MSKENFIEEILNGKAPLQHPRRSEKDIIIGLSAAIDTAQRWHFETGQVGQLCDVCDLLWQWHKEMVKAGLRNK